MFLESNHKLSRRGKVFELIIIRQMAQKDSSQATTYLRMHIKSCLWMTGIVFLSDDPEFIGFDYFSFVFVVNWCYIFWHYVCSGIRRMYIFQTIINRLRCKQSNIDLISFVFSTTLNDFAFYLEQYLAMRKWMIYFEFVKKKYFESIKVFC